MTTLAAPAAPRSARIKPSAPTPAWRVRPDAHAAAEAYRHAGAWVAAALDSGAEHVVFDFADVHALDFTSFALVLDRLRAAGRTVTVANVAPHLAVSLRELGLTHGARIEETAPRVPQRAAARGIARVAAEHTLAA